MGKMETREFTYVGMDLKQTNDGIIVSQQEYADNIPKFNVKPERAKETESDLSEEEKTQLQRMAGKIGWLARGTRPDLAFSQVEMSTNFLNGKVKDLNKAVKAMRKISNIKSQLVIKNLGPIENWSVEVNTDAALGNLNGGVDSTAGFIVLLRNRDGLCVPISWTSNKIKRIVDNTLAAECISLVSGLEEAVHVRSLIEEILGLKEKSIPVEAITDNRGTFDSVHSTTAVQDKRLRRDISVIKELLNEKEVTKVSWCEGKDQIADALTKWGAAPWKLLEVFQNGRRGSSK